MALPIGSKSSPLEVRLKKFCEQCGEKCSCPTCQSEIICGCPLQPLPKFCNQCGENLRTAVAKTIAPVASTSEYRTRPLQEPCTLSSKRPIVDSPSSNRLSKRRSMADVHRESAPEWTTKCKPTQELSVPDMDQHMMADHLFVTNRLTGCRCKIYTIAVFELQNDFFEPQYVLSVSGSVYEVRK